jgi:hypothetical protein
MPVAVETRERVDVEAILAHVNLEALITADRGAPDRSRKWLCPFHDDHNPSLGLARDRRHYRCWACGATGTAIDWLMELDGLTFREACSRLDTSGLPTSARGRKQAKPPPAGTRSGPTARPIPADEAEAMAELVEDAASRLWTSEGAAALAYLHGRGLRLETIRKSRLGWTEGDGRFPWRPPGLVIPWLGAEGRPVFVKVRVDDQWKAKLPADRQPPKYLAPRGWSQPAILYPSPAAVRPGLPFIVVEGELDALLVQQDVGDRAGVGTLGSATMGRAGEGIDLSIRRLLRPASGWLIATDADAAGDEAAARWMGYARARRIRPPAPFKDWGEMAVEAPESRGTAVNLDRWWGDVLDGDDSPRAFTWEDLAGWRWGPGLDDAELGIDRS